MTIADAIRKALNGTLPEERCKKVCYPTPAAAKKALRNHGYHIGCKTWHRCTLHGAEEIYHLTSRND